MCRPIFLNTQNINTNTFFCCDASNVEQTVSWIFSLTADMCDGQSLLYIYNFANNKLGGTK